LTQPRTDRATDQGTLPGLQRAAADCRASDLWKDATQTVFGEGQEHARILMVGEQPGDREDVEGKPFVGPAGRVLDEGLAAAQALLGSSFRVTQQRGEFLDRSGLPLVMATVHPSSILRAPDDESRELEMRAFGSRPETRGAASRA
jgi:uracil-DNA glycosylase